MQSATYVGITAQTVLDRSMEVIANNLANLSTTGFKGESSLFEQYLTTAGAGQKPVAYVRDAGTVRDLRQGDLQPTSNPLDAAIDGGGYFTVQTPDGVRYTRNGHFQIDNQQQLVTAQGYPVLDDRGNPILLSGSPAAITIAPDGGVSTPTGPVAKLGIAKFDSPQTLVSAADGLYVTDQTPSPDTASTVHQGALEGSNVSAVLQMTRLLGLQRAYTNTQEVLSGEDNRIKSAIDKLARVA